MEKINEILLRITALKDKYDNLAKELSGKDYDKYKNIYMTYIDGTEVEVNNNSFIINFQTDLCSQLFYSKGEFNLFGFFDDTIFSTNGIDFISIRNTTTHVSDKEYSLIYKILNYLENSELKYDSKKTTSLHSPLNEEYEKVALEEESKKLGLSDKRDYPTIEATVNFWSIFVVDYLLSRGSFVLANEEAHKKLSLFKENLAVITTSRIEKEQYSYINCYNDCFNYEWFKSHNSYYDVSHSPLLYALDKAGIDIDDFLLYYKSDIESVLGENSSDSLLETRTSLGGCCPIMDMYPTTGMCQFTPIPNNIKNKLEYYGYMTIYYARKNNIKKTDIKNIVSLARFLMKAYYVYGPKTMDIMDKGYLPNVDDKRLYDIILNPQGERFGGIKLMESFESFFVPVSYEKTTHKGR